MCTSAKPCLFTYDQPRHSPSLKAQIRYIQGGHTGPHTHAGDALWTQVHSDSARGRRQSARLIRFSSLKAVSATCERREQTKKEIGSGRRSWHCAGALAWVISLHSTLSVIGSSARTARSSFTRRPGAQLRKGEADAAGGISARVLAATAGHIPKVYDERRRLSRRAADLRHHSRRRGHRRRQWG